MIINDKKYKFLPFYKTFLFRFCQFKTDSKDDQDIIIVNALNIKNRKKRITFLYDSTCEYIDNFYNNENICGFKNCQCYIQRKKKSNLKYGCCRKCLYKNYNGCTTKNLACKLFNCSEVCCRRKTVKYKDLKVLKVLSMRQRFIVKSDFFSSREDILKDLYSYSVIYAMIRVVTRFIKNLIVLNRIEKIKD